jgi:hypothetical protein
MADGSQSGPITGGCPDLLCDRRTSGRVILMLLAALTSRRARDYAVRGRRVLKELTPSGSAA